MWQTRLEMLMSSVPSGEQGLYVRELQELISLVGHPMPSADTQSAKAGRDLSVRSDHGSVAGGVVRVEGDLRVEHPFWESPQEGSR